MKMIVYISHQEEVSVSHNGQAILYVQGKPRETADDLAESLCRQPEKFREATDAEVAKAKFDDEQAALELQKAKDALAAKAKPAA